MRISDWSSDVCSSDLRHDAQRTAPSWSPLRPGDHVHRRRARPRRNLRTLPGMEPRLIRPPFVLLEDLEGGTAKLFERQSEATVATTAAEVTSAIRRQEHNTVAAIGSGCCEERRGRQGWDSRGGRY